MCNLYKIAVYRRDRKEYFTFCTPECAKEIDDTIFKAIYGINALQKELAIMEALRK
jgi:hypothetical protein